MISLSDIRQVYRGEIHLTEPLSRHSALRIGGPADYYLEPQTKHELVRLVDYFQGAGFPFILLEREANLLVTDDGYRGAVICIDPALSEMRMEGQRVYAGAGVTAARFVDFCLHRSLQGPEALAGLSGTIGNLLGEEGMQPRRELAGCVTEVEVLRSGALVRTGPEYDHGSVASGVDVLVGAWFTFPAGNKTDLFRLRRENLLRQNAMRPVNIPHAAIMFRNPPDSRAAELIKEAGMLGASQGGAVVSVKHANLIVNARRATAADVLALIRKVQERVQDRFGVTLEVEMKLLGFDHVALREVA